MNPEWAVIVNLCLVVAIAIAQLAYQAGKLAGNTASCGYRVWAGESGAWLDLYPLHGYSKGQGSYLAHLGVDTLTTLHTSMCDGHSSIPTVDTGQHCVLDACEVQLKLERHHGNATLHPAIGLYSSEYMHCCIIDNSFFTLLKAATSAFLLSTSADL